MAQTTDETSQVWAVLKLFLHLLRKKKERKKDEFISTRPVESVENKISLIHVLTATDETSQVWAVLKLFWHLV